MVDLPEPLQPDDEGRHRADAEDPHWNESWYADWATDDGSLGGYFRFGITHDAVWYWACVVGDDRPLVTFLDHTLPVPAGDSLHVEGDRIAADHLVEEPWRRFRLQLQCEARALDDPALVFSAAPDGRLPGDPVALEYDLTWLSDGSVYPYPGVSRYEIPAALEGTVRIGDETIALEARAQRDHSFGSRNWWEVTWVWTSARLDDGSHLHATKVRIPGLDYEPGFVVPADGVLAEARGFTPTEQTGREGLPTHVDMTLDGMDLAVTPQHHSPVRVDGPDGATMRLQRSLCRFSVTDGPTGYGWTEIAQQPD